MLFGKRRAPVTDYRLYEPVGNQNPHPQAPAESRQAEPASRRNGHARAAESAYAQEMPAPEIGEREMIQPTVAAQETQPQKTSGGELVLRRRMREEVYPDGTWVDDNEIYLRPLGANPLYRLPEPLIQSLRHMATRLACEGNLPPRLSFVAALRQEGVTLVSQAFATMLAHDTGRRVCYVDLNWWWPSPHMHTLNTQTPGVAGVLKGETTWQRALIHTTRLNLNLLPAGLLSPAQRPSFARRPALGALLDEINRQHDFVILDIPALQASTDAVPLASLGKASCVVIRQGGSTRNAVCAALAGLHHMPIVGVAMNRVRIATPNWLLKWIPQG